MLRITCLIAASGAQRLELEGRLIGEWVAVLAQELARLGSLDAVQLDLGRLQFISPPGIELLEQATRAGARLDAVPPFILSLLEGARK